MSININNIIQRNFKLNIIRLKKIYDLLMIIFRKHILSSLPQSSIIQTIEKQLFTNAK